MCCDMALLATCCKMTADERAEAFGLCPGCEYGHGRHSDWCRRPEPIGGSDPGVGLPSNGG